jgi:hypothetical protein
MIPCIFNSITMVIMVYWVFCLPFTPVGRNLISNMYFNSIMIQIVEFRLLGLIMIPCIFNSIMFGKLRFHHSLPGF